MRLASRVYLLGSLAHLWLGDAWQREWAPYNLLYVLGLVALVSLGPVALAWLLCALGALGPLLFARDVLTQSVILCLMATSALVACLRIDPTVDASHERSASAKADQTLQAWHAMTIVVYALAALHKLNLDFFNPAVSCAQYGWGKLLAYWGIPLVTPSLKWLLPVTIIATELLIAALLWLRPRWAWTLAIAFHIPLTLTMAPAFAFVMAIGHAASLTTQAKDTLLKHWQSQRLKLLLGAALITFISQARHYLVTHDELLPTMMLKECLMWAMLGLSIRYQLKVRGDDQREPTPRRRFGALAWVFALLMLGNGLTPYLGVQAQHAGAMLSNLRIDRGCWNSLLIPEALRLTDDYVRIDRVQFAKPGGERYQQAYEQTLRSQLWSPPQLRQMRRNWCKPQARPFTLEGSYRQRRFVIKDLCDPQAPWAFADDGIFGVELFPDAIRFQKNLQKTCPQVCIH